MSFAYDDAEFIVRRKDAVVGSRRLRNAILRSMGYRVPKERRPPAQLLPRKRGRPLGSPNKTTRHRASDIKEIEKITANCCRVRIENLRGRRRVARMVEARQIAMWLARDELGASYPAIGRAFDRDHTTVLYACREVQKLIDAGHGATISRVNAIRARLAA